MLLAPGCLDARTRLMRRRRVRAPVLDPRYGASVGRGLWVPDEWMSYVFRVQLDDSDRL
jgi:hypothetical protein